MLPRTADRRGFTFLEVMVAVSILAIVLLTLFHLHSQTISLSGESRFRVQAALMAQEKLARMELKPLHELYGENGDGGTDYPGYTWQVKVEDLYGEALESLAERFKRITVTITGDDLTYEIATYRFCQR